MGYTHYWYREKEADRDAFKSWSEDVIRLADSGRLDFAVCGGDGTGLPEITEDVVCFNGDGANGLDHETFRIARVHEDPYSFADEDGLLFDFCKTARKPYDLLVCAALIRAKVYFPRWRVSSDGDPEDWEDAAALCRDVFHEEAAIPV